MRVERRTSKRALVGLLSVITMLSVLGTLGTVLAPTLAVHHPLLLIILDSRSRMLPLARNVGLWEFVIIASLRRFVKAPIYYLLGRMYGEAAIRWLGKRHGVTTVITSTERLFRRAAYPTVFLFPGALVCALAGYYRMRPAGFLLTNLAGTVAAVVIVRAVSHSIAPPIDALLNLFRAHIVVATLVIVAVSAASALYSSMRSRRSIPGELGGLFDAHSHLRKNGEPDGTARDDARRD